MLYFDKPIRSSLKFNDPIDFNFKLSSNISNIYFLYFILVINSFNFSNICIINKNFKCNLNLIIFLPN